MFRLLALLSALYAVPGAAQPAGDQSIVATVEDRAIPLRDLRAAAQDLVAKGQSPDEAKATALKALIDRQLMVVEAIAEGIEQGEVEQRRWRKMDGDLLREALEEDLVADLVVSEEELATYLDMTTREMVVREIVAPDSATAARALAEIRSGEDFGEVAVKYSIDPEAEYTGGLRPPILEAAIAMGPNRTLLDHRAGDIVGPVRYRQLYYLTRIEERRPVAKETWTADLLLPRLAVFKRSAALDEYLAEMKKKYHYTFNQAAARRIAGAVRMIMAEHDSLRAEIAADPGRDLPPDRIDFRPHNGGDVWGLSDSLRAAWIYKHDLGGRTVAIYVDRMTKVPTDWIATNVNPSKIEFYCEEFFRDDVYPLEAKQRGLDVKIDYEHKRRQRYEEVLTEQLYRREVFEKINPDVKTLKAHWEEHVNEFPVPDAITATSITFPTEEAAALARLRLESGETFEDLASEYEKGSAADSVEVRRGQRTTSDMTWLGGNLRDVPAGQIKIVRETDGRLCILHVDERGPGEPNFTRSYDNVLVHYRYAHDEPVMSTYLDKLRERYKVVVNEDLVAALDLSD